MTALILSMLLVVVAFAAPVDAAVEARCTDLGAECLCSEPLAAVNYVKVASQVSNPDDTTASDKECTTAGAPTGGAITWLETVSNLTSVTSATEAAAFAALPAGHSLTRIAKDARVAPNNEGGVLSHLIPAGQATGWLAIRWYQFYSSNFAFSGEGGCSNHKLVNIGWAGNFSYLTYGCIDCVPSTGEIMNSNLNAISGIDCCVIGPGGPLGVGDEAIELDYKGSWWRIEVIIIKRAGPGLHIIAYEKNITAGTPELKRVDTRNQGSCWPTGSPPCQWNQTSGITPPGIVNDVGTDWHRFQTCAGYRTMTHFMTAGSTATYTDQRIGASTEVEGGGSAPPVPPTNFQITMMARLLWVLADALLP